MSGIYPEVSATAETGDAANLCWFAAYTASHHEKQVFSQLLNRNVESYLPLYRATRQWQKRSSVTIDLPLFPNYVFVHISRKQRVQVLATPGVFSIVGSASNAWELPEREIEALRHGLRERKVEPHPYLVIGERARVRTGVLAGLEGVIVRKKNNLNIVLTLDQIMQSIAIEVEAAELEPVIERPKRTTGPLKEPMKHDGAGGYQNRELVQPVRYPTGGLVSQLSAPPGAISQ